MFALVCVSVLACAFAAPQYYRHPPPPFHHYHRHHGNFGMHPFMGDSVFDTANFWSQLSTEMTNFDNLMQEFMQHFPATVSTAGVEGNQYKINIPLTGFEEKDIVVKAREGLVMVQATQTAQDGNGKTYMDVRTIPLIVNVAGSWTYEQGALKIVFPLKEGSSTTEEPTETVSTEIVTEGPKEREELESEENQNANQDADVGVARGDPELLTNEIPTQDQENAVEATTYAIDVRDGFEFVPVRY